MDDPFVFAVKEDIIRTVLRRHSVIFLSGWSRTGKTVSLIRALAETGPVYYFSPSEDSRKKAHAEDVNIHILEDLASFQQEDTGETILIIDDFTEGNNELYKEVEALILSRAANLKIIVIVRAFLDIKGLIPKAEALLRLKKSTAEIIYSIWQDKQD